jgi:hypothetical protein
MSKSEDTWIASQRKVVQEYLEREGVDHLGVGEYPAFHLHPYVAVWAVQSKKAPGWVGWWAISGDLPTDYVSRGKIAHPREALRAFAHHWREMLRRNDMTQANMQMHRTPRWRFGFILCTGVAASAI